MTRLLLGQGLPRGTASDLRAAGFDAIHVGEHGLSSAPDEALLALAAADGRTICTLDADFGAALARTGAGGPSVLFVRIEGLGREEASRLFLDLLPSLEVDLAAGAIVVVDRGSMRVRRLPIA